MSNIAKFRTLAEVEDEAAAWLWRLDAETATPEDRKAFEAWLRRDPRHSNAYEEFAGVWRQLDDLAGAKRADKIATFADPPAATRSRRGLQVAMGLAATVLVLASSYLFVMGRPTSEAFATAVGQQRTVTLSDESVVTLNTNTIVETNFTSAARNVYLRKGEAHFVVSHDRSHPFIVHAGDSAVRAIGTAFYVRLIDTEQLDVIVTEGRVEVQAAVSPNPSALASAPERTTSATRLLGAGNRLRTVSGSVVVQEVTAEDLSNTLAWRQGSVVFEGQPLTEAIAELGRYTDTRFVITDPEVSSYSVGGRFRTNDVQGFLAALEKALPVVVRHAPDGVVYIEPQS